MGGLGLPELLIVLAILLVFFGAKRLPTLARSMGQASKEFKSGMKEGYTETPVEGPCPFCGVQVAEGLEVLPRLREAGRGHRGRARQEETTTPSP